MIFYTADTHFGFLPILKAAARPFATTEEMDAVLIKNWNERVSPEDTVYIVGDFAFDAGEVPGVYFDKLNGKKHIVRGNHDVSLDHQEDFYKYCESVTDFTELDDGDRHVILCHYPIIHNKRPYMIHGHIHNRRGQAYDMLKQLPRVLNAGVDINFFRPVTLDELIKNNEMYYSGDYPELFPNPEEGKTPMVHGAPNPEMDAFYEGNPHYKKSVLAKGDFHPLPDRPVK